MRREVVSELVLIVATQCKAKPRAGGEAAFVEPVIRLRANSRLMLGISCLVIVVGGVGNGRFTRQPALFQLSGIVVFLALFV